MRLFVANWKMNMTRREARVYAEELSERIGDGRPGVELAVAPPYTALEAARDPRGRWSLAAQNVASEAEGAFTGEVSARMLAEAGCRYVIVGHSERRRIFGEGGPTLARKLSCVRQEGLVPIYCVGETEEERDSGLGAEVLRRQVETLSGVPRDAVLLVAYEPVWAIGTGNAATPEAVNGACQELSRLLSGRTRLRILYGGSVTPSNAEEILERCGVQGFLIGGASLKAATFAAIAGI